MALVTRPSANPRVMSPPSASAAPLRRCTFRRVTVVDRAGELPMYDVACTFPDRRKAVALGDIEDARPVCDSCTYQGIFRPDAD